MLLSTLADFQIPYEAYVHRFTIDTRDWSMTRSNILPTHQPIELPMINQAWLTFPYQYAYYTWGIHTGLPQNFTKVSYTEALLLNFCDICVILCNTIEYLVVTINRDTVFSDLRKFCTCNFCIL